MSSDGPGQREVAHRLFAAEYDDADYSYSESDEDQAPNYLVTPTGARINRLFVVGVLTEVEPVNEEMLRGRIADPTGAFVLYAGQYEPDEQAMLERTDPPAFVAVTGKANTFEPDDGDRVYTSIRPESINTVDAETRDRWSVQAAEQTVHRVGHAATALSTGLTGDELRETLETRGTDPALAEGISRALAHYGTTPTYLDAVRDLALDTARVVAGERDQVRGLTSAPDGAGEVTAAELAAVTSDTDRTVAADDTTGAGQTGEPADGEPTTTAGGSVTDSGATADSQTASDPSTASDRETTPEFETVPDTGAASGRETDSVDTGDDVVQSGDTEEFGVSGEPGDAEVVGEDPGEFEPGDFELPDEVRDEVEEEYGTEFQSGTEVDDPGEADIQPPETETGSETTGAVESAPAPGARDTDTAPESTTGGATDVPDTGPDEQADDAAQSEAAEDPQAAVLTLMKQLDDGDGVDRTTLVTEAGDRHGLTETEVEEAIDGALMDGQCYEPDERSLKPI